MKTALYISDVVFVILAIAAFVVSRRCKDPGYLFISLICAVSAVSSFFFLSWLPLAVAGVAVTVLFLVGTGRTR